MPDEAMTLGSFFFDRQPAESRVGRELGRSSQLDEMRAALGKEMGKTRWKLVAKEIGKQIAAVMDFGIAERILAPAWQRLEVFQEYRDPELHPPDESALVPLVEHRVHSTHEPHIDLLLKGVEVGRLTLAIDLALNLQGIVVRVQDGRIWGVQTGSAAGGGSLSCTFREQSVYSVQRDSQTFQLGSGLGFANGIQIPALEAED